MPRTRKEIAVRLCTTPTTNPSPVYSSDAQPLMPTHPARARNLLLKGRAVPHHVKGLFGIRLLDRTRAQSSVQDVGVNIDPGSQTTGIAVVTDDDEGGRAVLAALEIKHRAFNIKATLTKRRSFRRNRRARLRFRAPRFDNRRRKPGTLPPSVDSLRIDTMRVVSILRQMYPISSIRLERKQVQPATHDDPRHPRRRVPTRHPFRLAGQSLHPRPRRQPLRILPPPQRASRTRPRTAPSHRPRLASTTSSPAAGTAIPRKATSPSNNFWPTNQSYSSTSRNGCNDPTWRPPHTSTL